MQNKYMSVDFLYANKKNSLKNVNYSDGKNIK